MAAILIMAALYLCPVAEASDFTVKVARGRLSVKADNAPFGSLMDKIAKSAGFEVVISPDVAQKSLTTEFKDLDMERGIQRLMGLISHRNFFMFYGRDGNIKKIEIYGAKGASTAKPAKRRPPAADTVPGTVPPGMVPLVLDPPEGTGSEASAPKKPGNSKLDKVPYIPPASLPEYIPPRRGIGGSSPK